MRTSISITSYAVEGGPAALADHLRCVVETADETGIDTVWVADHLLQADPAADPGEPMLEAYATLGYLAAVSTRVRLGAMVSPVTFRSPAVLLKAVATLDVLSGGRAWLGLGAGYQGEEARAMGLALLPVAERFEHLEDTLRLAHRMRAEEEPSFRGHHHTLDGPLRRPAPLTRPHLPILVGGTGERHTLRLAAQYADACNLFDIPDGGATVRHKLEVLRGHLADAGRSPGDVETTISTALGPGEDAASFRSRCEVIAGLGIGHVVVITRGRPWDSDAVSTVAAARDVQAP